jgi:hypothetical protein
MQDLTTSTARPTSPPAKSTGEDRTSALLACGVVAGPLFVAVGLLQMLTRDGFDPTRHPLSLLSLGDLGWVQITNFVLAGLLFAASAVGMRRVLRAGPGRTWGPGLIGIYGAALIMGGVFVADPALGFPPGTPEGIPDQVSWHGALHSVAPVLASLALVAACLVFARRFAVEGRRGWTAASLAVAVIDLVPAAFSGHDLFFVAMGVSVSVGLGWLSALAARLRAERQGVPGIRRARLG